jgi:hypothetical protein
VKILYRVSTGWRKGTYVGIGSSDSRTLLVVVADENGKFIGLTLDDVRLPLGDGAGQ